MDKICQRVVQVGREPTVLPILHDQYKIISTFFNSACSEAVRLGIIKRKIKIDNPDQFLSTAELANTVSAMYKVAARLLIQVLEFGRRFQNDCYQVTLFLNLARLQSAEIELNMFLNEGEKFLKKISLLQISNTF